MEHVYSLYMYEIRHIRYVNNSVYTDVHVCRKMMVSTHCTCTHKTTENNSVTWPNPCTSKVVS